MSAARWLWDFLSWLVGLLKHLVPRFITEDVAVERVRPGDGWDAFEIVCGLEDVEPGERLDGLATVDAFTWLCFGITYRVSEIRPFVNPHNDGEAK